MPEVSQQQPRTAFWLQYLSLFSSLGTLLCCALPSLLVLLGLGATVASVLSSALWLVALSRHRNLVFAVAGALIAMNIFYSRTVGLKAAQCGIGDDACAKAARLNRVLLWISVTFYGIGFAMAYLLGPFFVWLDHSQ